MAQLFPGFKNLCQIKIGQLLWKQIRYIGMRLIIITFLFAICNSVYSQNFDSLQWQNRVLVLHAPIEKSNLMEKQIKYLLQDTAGLNERRLKIYVLNKNQLTEISTDTIQNDKFYPIPLKKRKMSNSVLIELFGLDGGLKKTWNTFLDRKKLYSVIDAMPMRIREIKGY